MTEKKTPLHDPEFLTRFSEELKKQEPATSLDVSFNKEIPLEPGWSWPMSATVRRDPISVGEEKAETIDENGWHHFTFHRGKHRQPNPDASKYALTSPPYWKEVPFDPPAPLLLGWNGKYQGDHVEGNYTISLTSPYGSMERYRQLFEGHAKAIIEPLVLVWIPSHNHEFTMVIPFRMGESSIRWMKDNDHLIFWMSPKKISDWRRRLEFDVQHYTLSDEAYVQLFRKELERYGIDQNEPTNYKVESYFYSTGFPEPKVLYPTVEIDPEPVRLLIGRGFTAPYFYGQNLYDFVVDLPNIEFEPLKAPTGIVVDTRPVPYPSGKLWFEAMKKMERPGPIMVIDSFTDFTSNDALEEGLAKLVADMKVSSKMMIAFAKTEGLRGSKRPAPSPYRQAMKAALLRLSFKRDMAIEKLSTAEGLKKIHHQVAGSMRHKKHKHRLKKVMINTATRTIYTNCYPINSGELATKPPDKNGMVELKMDFNFDQVITSKCSIASKLPYPAKE